MRIRSAIIAMIILCGLLAPSVSVEALAEPRYLSLNFKEVPHDYSDGTLVFSFQGTSGVTIHNITIAFNCTVVDGKYVADEMNIVHFSEENFSLGTGTVRNIDFSLSNIQRMETQVTVWASYENQTSYKVERTLTLVPGPHPVGSSSNFLFMNVALIIPPLFFAALMGGYVIRTPRSERNMPKAVAISLVLAIGLLLFLLFLATNFFVSFS
ncbi:MAG: hypothetical protein A4E32_01426 [Methanomassiliicoccales archaeon PtaU1.Bin124]|nr:MAG: hypothetical protein A4E32_01426 [Methanomassiliicoccales archaeon PtaU1.Bin124]